MQDRLRTLNSIKNSTSHVLTMTSRVAEWGRMTVRHVNAEEKCKDTDFKGGCVGLDMGTGGKVTSSATDRP